MKILNKSRYLAVAMLALLVSSCVDNNDSGAVDRWIVGILPDQDKAEIFRIYRPLMDYLSNETGVQYEIRVPDSYQELLDWFGNKQINLALFGGVTFVKAHRQYNAVPITKRDVDGNYSHYVLARSDIIAGNLAGIKGLKFAFGSPLSTSGHIMPRFYFQQSGVDPETYFSEILYSGAHDKTALLIQDGTVDAGAANTGVVRKMYDNGELDPNKVRILWQSLPYQDYVFATQEDVSEAARDNLLNAFLKLNQGDASHRIILERLGANYYLPSLVEEFEQINSVVFKGDRE
ncbi:MAG: phosphate/phosphite/phosphonate ABC transporter substrate-binding protein [Gammaproteobacteria bacterium]|nr:phosphate/phosphite/phosphonate ABC transporter substrate-binding protein [Gammaproteobacteria bacterium]